MDCEPTPPIPRCQRVKQDQNTGEATGILRGTTYTHNGAGPYYRKDILHDPCVYCGGKATTLDHIHPKSDGGSNGWSNMAPSCLTCNSKKKSRGLIEFLLDIWRSL
jgi:5-methylcytosine-specific restriction endonuclease McrA